MTDKAKQGRSNRRKGGAVELQLVKSMVAAGIKALKVPLSGAMAGWKGDIEIDSPVGKLVSEVKSRKGGAGFATLEKWMGDNDLLMLHRNRAEPLVMMRMSLFIRLVSFMLHSNAPSVTITHGVETEFDSEGADGSHQPG